MNDGQLQLLKDIWASNIVGKKFDGAPGDIKDYLFKSLISRNHEILSSFNIKIPDTGGKQFLNDLALTFSKIDSHPLGFFPIGILRSKKLTCAGSAMLINTLLNKKGFKAYYARPAFHSVNLVNLDGTYYWVDSNGYSKPVKIQLEQKETFSVAYVKSDYENINYKIVPLFTSENITINVFGNMEALKMNNDPDPLVQEYLTNNSKIQSIDFNDYKDYLFKEYFDFVRYDKEFADEQQRVKEWLES